MCMSDDPTELLHDILAESGCVYEAPHDIITADELVGTIESDDEDEYDPRVKKRKFIPFEKDIRNYDIPDNLTEEEMREIITSMSRRTNRGFTQSPETREKISIALTGVVRSKETCNKIRDALTGKKHTKEHNENISKSIAGKKRKPMSEETKKKISESVKRRHKEKSKNNAKV